MIFDMQSLFSDAQAFTGSVFSDNIIDQGPTGTPVGGSVPLKRDLGAGGPVPIRIQVVETFVGNTNITVQVQTSDDEAFASFDIVTASAPIVVADLVAGYVAPPQYIPPGTDKRYIRLRYLMSGTATAGKITAGIVCGNQTNG